MAAVSVLRASEISTTVLDQNSTGHDAKLKQNVGLGKFSLAGNICSHSKRSGNSYCGQHGLLQERGTCVLPQSNVLRGPHACFNFLLCLEIVSDF